jgi:hypothetical protein
VAGCGKQRVDHVPMTPLDACIAMALTYHCNKR